MVKAFRVANVPLGRLPMACRSHDLTMSCIYRGIWSKREMHEAKRTTPKCSKSRLSYSKSVSLHELTRVRWELLL